MVATFTDTDEDQADDYAGTIDWGDGTVTPGVVAAAGNGRFNVLGYHVYETFGFYPVLVSVEQADGSVATATAAATVVGEAGFVEYRVAIDTSSLAGTNGRISLQFNPAESSMHRRGRPN